ncbi:heavy metal translocating P-type ATPase [Candidatus Synechococcus calcipolaris G9]|uniref:Heavy metal translocating P-type ATPase n=1 Tax=Candidatus Synechococcus calcipolaris G9 TaxID=1497997 RepID=A0ABT6EZC9_9SYNE|nr:heavy metal translocating P-type ATPase [Candidatus Synechococcus calcipolaris]MDG2990963.1 heavy metal translocating P-type ATPase [Candidatus Synechococcus calcipolaris G9]
MAQLTSAVVPRDSTPMPSATIALNVGGMRCGGCVKSVERILLGQEQVTGAAVNLMTGTAMVTYQVTSQGTELDPQDLADRLTAAGFKTHVPNPADPLDWTISPAESPSPWPLVSALGLLLLSSLGHLQHIVPIHVPILSSMLWHWALATVALLGPGRRILQEGGRGAWEGRPNMNTLVALGSLAAYGASGVAWLWPQLGWECFFDEPVMMISFILLGRTLEERARSRAKHSLQALLALQPAIAQWLPHPDSETSLPVPVTQIQPGDWLRVLGGDKFPVDGYVVRGETLVEESMLTGESLPVPKVAIAPDTLPQPTDQRLSYVIAGSMNQLAPVTIQADRRGQDTFLGQILALVTAAQTRKAPVQQFADTLAGYFCYGVLTFAALTFAFWFLGGRSLLGLTDSQSVALISLKLAITVLVIACPCALGLATPTAILVGTSRGAEQGLLIRGGDILEQVQQLTTIAFDKTGTLTTGKLTLESLESVNGMDTSELLRWAASLEQEVHHPLANAIAQAWQTHCAMAESDGTPNDNDMAQNHPALLPVTHKQVCPGQGIRAVIQDQPVAIGRLSWLETQGIDICREPSPRQAMSQIGLAINGELAACFTLADTLRADAKITLEALKSLGLTVHVLTGDQRDATLALLQPLSLSPEQIHTRLLPGEKVTLIQTWQSQGEKVAMVGDGINDGPALTTANVGIALASGTDVALEAADIVLIHNQLEDVVTALALGRATLGKIRQNLFWACAYNLVGLPIAAGVLLPHWHISLTPSVAAACMAVSSIAVVTNSLLLKPRSPLR